MFLCARCSAHALRRVLCPQVVLLRTVPSGREVYTADVGGLRWISALGLVFLSPLLHLLIIVAELCYGVAFPCDVAIMPLHHAAAPLAMASSTVHKSSNCALHKPPPMMNTELRFIRTPPKSLSMLTANDVRMPIGDHASRCSQWQEGRVRLDVLTSMLLSLTVSIWTIDKHMLWSCKFVLLHALLWRLTSCLNVVTHALAHTSS